MIWTASTVTTSLKSWTKFVNARNPFLIVISNVKIFSSSNHPRQHCLFRKKAFKICESYFIHVEHTALREFTHWNSGSLVSQLRNSERPGVHSISLTSTVYIVSVDSQPMFWVTVVFHLSFARKIICALIATVCHWKCATRFLNQLILHTSTVNASNAHFIAFDWSCLNCGQNSWAILSWFGRNGMQSGVLGLATFICMPRRFDVTPSSTHRLLILRSYLGDSRPSWLHRGETNNPLHRWASTIKIKYYSFFEALFAL